MIDMRILLTALDSNTSVIEVSPGAFAWRTHTIHGTRAGQSPQTWPTQWQAAYDWLQRFKPDVAR